MESAPTGSPHPAPEDEKKPGQDNMVYTMDRKGLFYHDGVGNFQGVKTFNQQKPLKTMLKNTYSLPRRQSCMLAVLKLFKKHYF